MSNPTRRRLALLFVALALVGGGYVLRGWYLPALARWLDVGEQPVPVDYAIVLPGDASSRPFVAAALYRAGLARQIAMPSPMRTPEVIDGDTPSDTDITRRALLALGVPSPDIIVMDGASQSTFDDARAVRALLGTRHATSIAVVTSHYHTRRSRWVFRHVLSGLPVQIHMVSAPTDYFDADNWWRVQAGFTTCSSEYVKFAYYLLRYGTAAWWIAATVALVLAAWLIRRRRRLAIG